MNDAAAEALDAGCRALTGTPPGASERGLLLAYLDLLVRWNRAYNLTAITAPVEMVRRHLLDSLAILPFAGTGRLLDAGSGAGLPGVPLAIMRPALEVTLLDGSGKKVRFLRHVQRALALENIQPVQSRLDEWVPADPPDAVVCRALGSLADFAGAARALLTPDNRLLAMKGRLAAAELAQVPDWLAIERVVALTVPGLQAQRHLVIMSLRP